MSNIPILLILILLLGCSVRYQNLSPETGVQLTVKNNGPAAMTNIYTDKNCTKLPSGEWLGNLGKAKISSMSEYQKTVYIAPDVIMTLYMEWYDGPHLGVCARRATFTPMIDFEYEVEYTWNAGQCDMKVMNRAVDSDVEFRPMPDGVEYDSVHCSH